MPLALTAIIGPAATYGVAWIVVHVLTPGVITGGELHLVMVCGSVSMIGLLTADWVHSARHSPLLIYPEPGRATESDIGWCGSSCLDDQGDVITF